MSFSKEMYEAEQKLSQLGHQPFLPDMTEANYKGMTAEQIQKLKDVYMWHHIHTMEKSDAVIVLNYNKKGFQGYIGANTFLEMAIAWYRKMPIFILNDIDATLPTYEEIIGMKPVFLHGKLEAVK